MRSVELLAFLIIPNALAPILFWAVLQFRRPFVRLCGGAKQACWCFFGLQAAVTCARAYGTKQYTGTPDWGTFEFGIPAVGYALIAAGIILNIFVYYRLGVCGVYYGSAFGVKMPWCTQWPYGPAGPLPGIPHPQYWGVFAQTLGVALHAGTVFALAFTLVTGIAYVVIVKVENHYFSEIDNERKKSAR